MTELTTVEIMGTDIPIEIEYDITEPDNSSGVQEDVTINEINIGKIKSDTMHDIEEGLLSHLQNKDDFLLVSELKNMFRGFGGM